MARCANGSRDCVLVGAHVKERCAGGTDGVEESVEDGIRRVREELAAMPPHGRFLFCPMCGGRLSKPAEQIVGNLYMVPCPKGCGTSNVIGPSLSLVPCTVSAGAPVELEVGEPPAMEWRAKLGDVVLALFRDATIAVRMTDGLDATGLVVERIPRIS